MGWISWTLTQVAITSITLGALKRSNIISVHPDNIKNSSFRMAVVQALHMGEEVNIMAEKLVAGVQEEISKGKRN